MSSEVIAALLSSGSPRNVARVWTPPLGRDAPRGRYYTRTPFRRARSPGASGQGDARGHPSLHGEAAVCHEGGPRDVRGEIGSEEHDHIGHFLGATKPPHGDLPDGALGEARDGQRGPEERRVDGA